MEARKQILGILAPACLLVAALAGAADKPNHTHHFSLDGKNEVYKEGGAQATVNLSAVHSEGRMSIQDEIWPAGFSVPAHFHKKHAEVFYLLTGKLQWTVNGETHEMGAGDLVYIPPNAVHSVKVLGTDPVRTLMLYEPGGYEEYRFNGTHFSAAALKEPKTQAHLRTLMDFHAVEGEGAVAPPRVQNPMHHFALNNRLERRDGSEEAWSVLLTALQTEGRMSLLDEIWPAGYKVEPHFHKKHAEIFYIVSGQVEWTVGGEAHVMTGGDLVYIPPNTVHSVRTVGDQDMRTLMIYEPGGYEEYELHEVGYTKEQLETPEVKARLRKLGDFNPVAD